MAGAPRTSATAPSVAAALSRRYGVWLIAIAIAVVLPWLFSGGAARTVISQMGVAIIFALSYNMLLGQGGMLSFGHAVYFGLAGFCVVHIIEGIQGDTIPAIPLWLLPLAGGLFG
ncbi:MAG: branched-chain amino acid ABC transporter permease, partial [Bauldia litoralis]